MAQRLTSIGLKQGGETTVSSNTNFLHQNPRVAVSDDGWFTVTWVTWGGDGDKGAIMARTYDPNGNPLDDPEQVNLDSAGDQALPDVKMLPGRRPVIVWQALISGSPSWDLYLRVLPPLDLTAPDEGGEGG